MNISNGHDINILDLPDELLRAIFNKLSTIDIFYSLVNINERFNQLVFDPLYIYHLNFSEEQSDISNSSMSTDILDRIFSTILPRISAKIEKLTSSPFFMKSIGSKFILTNQKHLMELSQISLKNTNVRILSSTLTKLKIDVNTLNECLFLLDHRLPCLLTLNICIDKIRRSLSMMDNTEKVIKLKCFSLTTNSSITSSNVTSFRGGRIFDTVRTLLMRDTRPFEQPLFKIICQDFPFLNKLIIINNHQVQENKQSHSLELLTFRRLFTLNLVNAHNDYAIQFLSDKTHLPCLKELLIGYETLVTITDNFTNDVIRSKCAHLRGLFAPGLTIGSKNFDSYFPSL
ncbi:hypothetical protein I4U23_004814 [Adineta vaga]|nr:hypothetical protein I4U23_004814 [Adineta vaga]